MSPAPPPPPPLPNDWRRRGQERYLIGARLTLRDYASHRPGWDHDHCEFCTVKLMPPPASDPDALTSGYATNDGYHWVCPACFEDFRDEFRFSTP